MTFFELRTNSWAFPAFSTFYDVNNAWETAKSILIKDPDATFTLTRIQTHRQPGFWAWLRGRRRPNIQVVWSYTP
jgi:hypothetical protein